MKKAELDRLLKGAPGVTLYRKDASSVHFERRALENPQAMRAAWRRQVGHEIPRYNQEQHDQIVRVIFMLCEASS